MEKTIETCLCLMVVACLWYSIFRGSMQHWRATPRYYLCSLALLASIVLLVLRSLDLIPFLLGRTR